MAKVKKVIVLQPTEENMIQFEQRAARVTARILGDILPPQIIDELIRILKKSQD
ncbi:4-alpha-glucanotransferase [Clostridium sp. BSD9I1]|uniref:4-alpha-glucanotransferase n=1 Tax=Clostridium sp. BSD9I1 TaxID=2003589 RepID=UPI00164851A2|nr:4-alpha-glucanotransferase [Clostridium sp. BSD9I1]